MRVTVPPRGSPPEHDLRSELGSREAFMLTQSCGHLKFAVSSHWSRTVGRVEKRDAMTTLSRRRHGLVHSARTGPGPGSCAPTPLALVATLDARHSLAVRLSPMCAVPPVLSAERAVTARHQRTHLRGTRRDGVGGRTDGL